MAEITIDGVKYIPKEDRVYKTKKEIDAEVRSKVERELEILKRSTLQDIEAQSLPAFPLEVEVVLLEKLGELFAPITEGYMSELTAMKQERISVLGPAGVCLIASKSERAKNLLRKFVCEENAKMPNLEYNENNLDTHIVKVTMHYLCKIMDVVKVISDNSSEDTGLILRTQTDYPLVIETEDFEFILAPRVESD